MFRSTVPITRQLRDLELPELHELISERTPGVLLGCELRIHCHCPDCLRVANGKGAATHE